jgi:long-subunit fatty acid transport protein
LGLALTAPFGLTSQYDADWVGRYQAIKTKIVTVNINPNAVYRFSDWLAVGGGPAIQHADAVRPRSATCCNRVDTRPFAHRPPRTSYLVHEVLWDRRFADVFLEMW